MGKLTLPDGAVYEHDGEAAKSAATWDGESVAGLVVKAEDERRYTLTVAYPADKADVAQAQDGHRDFASKEAVEQAAWNYMLKSRVISLWHEEGTDGAGDVVESYVYRGPDWAIKVADGSEVLVKSGDWLLGILWSPDAWPMVKEGRIRGVSPEGSARRGKPAAEIVAGLRN